MLILYHAAQSRSSRIIWLLEELGADYDIAYVGIPRMDGSGSPDTDNPHPDKKVPALLHDGELITESVAITLYLTDLFPEARIAPMVGGEGRGPYLSWLAYYAGVMEPVLNLQFMELGEHEGLKRVFRGRAKMDQRILDALQTSDNITGDTFSAVDVIIASLGHLLREMLPAGDLVDAYLERCGARPALERAKAKDAPKAA